MSHSHRARSPFSRALRGVRHALAEDTRPGRRHSTPMHEALALGLGLAPAPRTDERDGRR